MCQSAVFSPLVSGESFTLCGEQLPRSGSAKTCRPDRVNRLRGSGAPIATVQRKRVPHTDTCPPVKTKYFYALHYKSDVL